MKSMMEEASSVFKAIENCWSRAGKPEEFTVKILELPQKNFLGITTKAAKIALFYNQPASAAVQTVEQPRHKQQRQPQQEQPRAAHTQERREQRRPEQQPRPAQQRAQQAPQQAREEKTPYADRVENRVERTERRQDAPREFRNDNRHDNRRDQRSDFRSRQTQRGDQRDQRDQRDSRPEISWNQEMVEATQDWLKETLVMMDQSNINVHANYSGNFLKVELSEPIESDFRQEEVLFKSWTNLIFEVLREKFKTSTRGLRLVIESRKKV